MKQILILILLLFFGGFNIVNAQLTGAWKNTSGGITTVVLFQNGYFTATTFSGSSFTATLEGLLKLGKTKWPSDRIQFGEKELGCRKYSFRTI